MTQDQINGVVRAVLPAVLTYFAAKGYVIDGSLAEIFAISSVTAAAAAWSIWSNRPSRKPIGG